MEAFFVGLLAAAMLALGAGALLVTRRLLRTDPTIHDPARRQER